MKDSRVPIVIAIVLLLLPMLYLGSYLALVRPSGYWFHSTTTGEVTQSYIHGYRYFGQCSEFDSPLPWAARIAPAIFWPLEQIDRRVRPEAWDIER